MSDTETVWEALWAAERRVAAALAEHRHDVCTSCHEPHDLHVCTCGYPWDTVLDRCTSPTVTALVGEL